MSRAKTLLIADSDRPSQWMYGSDFDKSIKIIPVLSKSELDAAIDRFGGIIDCVLIDSELEGSSILSLIGDIRRTVKGKVVTTISRDGDFSKFIKAGANHVLNKSENIARLLTNIL